MNTKFWYDLNTMKAFEHKTMKQIELSRDEIYQEDDIPHPPAIEKGVFTNERGLHLVEATYEDGHGGFMLEDLRFANPEMEHFNEQIGPEPANQRREKQRGESLGKSRRGKVAILRTQDAASDTFKPMDYVVANYLPLTKSAISKVEGFFEGEEELRTSQGKVLKFLAEHAQTMALSYGRPQHVIMAYVSVDDVYEATNPGEYFYDGEVRNASVIFGVDEFGNYYEPSIEKDTSLEL